MAILPILCFPDPRLHKVAKPVAAVDERIQTLVADDAGCCGAIRTHLNDAAGGLAALWTGRPWIYSERTLFRPDGWRQVARRALIGRARARSKSPFTKCASRKFGYAWMIFRKSSRAPCSSLARKPRLRGASF